MQQRQLRLGDVLDDYCPRERRVTNHAIVAMIGPDVKQTRCTTCDTEHEYKQAKVPRQRKKSDTPAALYAQVLATGPKRVAHEAPADAPAAPEIDDSAEPAEMAPADDDAPHAERPARHAESAAISASSGEKGDDAEESDEPAESDAAKDDLEEGPVHRPLIRATLPRQEGAPPPPRPAPEFTIRQPGGGRQNRFRPRPGGGRGPQQFQNNRSNSGGNGNTGGGGPHRGGMSRQGGGRPPQGTAPRVGRRGGPGRNRPK